MPGSLIDQGEKQKPKPGVGSAGKGSMRRQGASQADVYGKSTTGLTGQNLRGNRTCLPPLSTRKVELWESEDRRLKGKAELRLQRTKQPLKAEWCILVISALRRRR